MKWYKLNPCDSECFRIIAPIGKFLWYWMVAAKAGTECECCQGARIFFAVLVALIGGIAIGANV